MLRTAPATHAGDFSTGSERDLYSPRPERSRDLGNEKKGGRIERQLLSYCPPTHASNFLKMRATKTAVNLSGVYSLIGQ